MSAVIIDKSSIMSLSRINTYLSISNLIINWMLIFLMIWISEFFWHPVLYVLSIILISARMHAIGTLAHEATHYMLVKNKKWNNKIGEWFITFPLFYSLNQYRKYHLAHHSHLNTEKDPDVQNHRTYKEFQFPLKKIMLFWIVFKDIVGINFLIYKFSALSSQKFWQQTKASWSWQVIFYYLVVFGGLFFLDLHFIFLKYWVVAYVTWLQFIQRVRTIAEHNAVPQEATSGTRTTLTSLLDLAVFGPNNTNYHAEHHLYPSVPFYNLPKLHKLLMKNEQFKSTTHFSKGYFNVLKECVS